MADIRWNNIATVAAVGPAIIGHTILRDVYPQASFLVQLLLYFGISGLLLLLFWCVGWWPTNDKGKSRQPR